MQKINLYYNSMKNPVMTQEVQSKEMIKHQIATMILLTADQYEIKKMRIALEDVEENS